MGYDTTNHLGKGARLRDVRDFIELLGYKKLQRSVANSRNMRVEEYYFFDEEDYRSWSGVLLSIETSGTSTIVNTRTSIAGSANDLNHQNHTVRQLKKRFGGHFQTDEGKGRYLRPEGDPPTPAASGCHLAFDRFGHNLIQAALYLQTRTFPKQFQGVADEYLTQMRMSPRLLSNNMLLPFLVACLEAYFKSTFIALLKYSPRRDTFFKSARLQAEQLTAVSSGKSVESQIAETLSFQSLRLVSRHFESLDPKLDIAGVLRRPYRRRKQSLHDLIEEVVADRHNFIHRAELAVALSDEKVEALVHDLDEAVTRVYRCITSLYKWDFDRGWHLGNRRATNRRKP